MIAIGVFILLCTIAFLFFWKRALWLWYVLVFLGPFTGLVLNFSQFGWTKDLPYVGHINAPYADFVALFLLALSAAGLIIRAFKGRLGWPSLARATGWYFVWPFLLVAFLSIVQVDPDTRASAFKYFLRPIVFFYAIWVLIPHEVVINKRIFRVSMLILFATGVIAACMGALSLVFNEAAFGVFTRATPLGWGSWYPFGWNQNLLAEVLVATAPLAGYFMVRAQTVQARKWYFLSFILIAGIALLTFSRAAWIALGIQGIIYVRWYERHSWGLFLRFAALIVLVLSPLIMYMAFFLNTSIVSSSDATRIDLTGIAWSAFTQHPLLGNGVGSFVPLVEETRVFMLEYGDPLDAHGVLQKLIAEVGLLGTIAFIVFAAWCIARVWSVWQSRDRYSASYALMGCWFLSVAGSFVFQLFNTSYYGAHLWLPVGLALAGARLFENPHHI